MKKSTILVLGIISLLIVSLIMWSMNKSTLNNPEVKAFSDRLMANHPKIERVQTTIHDPGIAIQIFYKEDQISREELIEIRDALKATYTLDFIKEVSKEHWKREQLPYECRAEIFLDQEWDTEGYYDYVINSHLDPVIEQDTSGNDTLKIDRANFKYWYISSTDGSVHIKDTKE